LVADIGYDLEQGAARVLFWFRHWKPVDGGRVDARLERFKLDGAVQKGTAVRTFARHNAGHRKLGHLLCRPFDRKIKL